VPLPPASVRAVGLACSAAPASGQAHGLRPASGELHQLSVTAKDKGSGKEQSISITGDSTLSDNEVERMVKDAESNAAVDKEKREKIDLKNQAETLI